jgi:hypothetical protein
VKLLRVKKDMISPATWFGAIDCPSSLTNVFCTICIKKLSKDVKIATNLADTQTRDANGSYKCEKHQPNFSRHEIVENTRIISEFALTNRFPHRTYSGGMLDQDSKGKGENEKRYPFSPHRASQIHNRHHQAMPTAPQKGRKKHAP